jgi:hypothetical protein
MREFATRYRTWFVLLLAAVVIGAVAYGLTADRDSGEVEFTTGYSDCIAQYGTPGLCRDLAND